MIYESMWNHINDAICKDDERLRKEKESVEDARRLQKQRRTTREKGNTGRYNKIKNDIGRKRERESYVERERITE